MVFSYKKGAVMKAPAQIAGEVCLQLEQSGGLTPERLLESSRSVNAPLHDEFEWNDSLAAEKWRTEQAADIIRHIVVEIDGQSEPQEIRAFFNLSRHEHEYISINIIQESEDQYNRLKEIAVMEFKALKKKYEMILELTHLYKIIDNL